MAQLFRQHDFNTLRQQFVFFSFEKIDFCFKNDAFHVTYHFNLSDAYYFSPQWIFPAHVFSSTDRLSDEEIETLLFQLGMVELISYWKCACPEQVIIKPFKLSDEQVNWWKKLYFNGLGEFFYLNGIDTNIKDFMHIECVSNRTFIKVIQKNNSGIMIPVGGGKDSVVTMQLLKNFSESNALIINPRGATEKTAINAGIKSEAVYRLQRSIHPQLLELNDKGFLNGHTPFSALLAFAAFFVAAASGKKYIALSNEASANESTVLQSDVNHQYSKSFEFENDFRNYVTNYLSEDIAYFSFLRPLSEIQIVALFAQFRHQYHDFKSCNAGSKTDTWCCACPKCLFTYIMLAPFIEPKDLDAIFGKNLFEDKALLRVMRELAGLEKVKPFECVGTVSEVNAALQFLLSKYEDSKLPFLLAQYKSFYKQYNIPSEDLMQHLRYWNPEHHLPKEFEKLLNEKINAISIK